MRRAVRTRKRPEVIGDQFAHSPDDMAATRLLRDTDKILEEAEGMDDTPVKRDLIGRATINCLKLCVFLKESENDD